MLVSTQSGIYVRQDCDCSTSSKLWISEDQNKEHMHGQPKQSIVIGRMNFLWWSDFLGMGSGNVCFDMWQYKFNLAYCQASNKNKYLGMHLRACFGHLGLFNENVYVERMVKIYKHTPQISKENFRIRSLGLGFTKDNDTKIMENPAETGRRKCYHFNGLSLSISRCQTDWKCGRNHEGPAFMKVCIYFEVTCKNYSKDLAHSHPKICRKTGRMYAQMVPGHFL